MGCDGYVFKVDQTKIASKFAESADLKSCFEKYVIQKNIEQKRINTWLQLDAEAILLKIKTDLHQLSHDEFWEILMWLNYSTAEDPSWGLQFKSEKVNAKLHEFGFNYIEDFQDNTRVFLFALGDFKHDVYNSSWDETREYACLTHEEFNLFLDYISYLYATVLISSNEEYSNRSDYQQFAKIITECSKDPLLKRLVTEHSEEIISTKSVEQYGMVFGTFSREVCCGDFEQAIDRCQRIKEQLKGNPHPIIILDS